MTFHQFGDPASDRVLIQPVDPRELEGLPRELELIRGLAGGDFVLLAPEIEDWNRQLSPWEAPGVFGDQAFGGGAGETLEAILAHCGETGKTRYLGGYSLAGLFALWAATQTQGFAGIAAASPSVWFPGFVQRFQAQPPKTGRIYLSLGDREERSRNPVLRRVGDQLRGLHAWLEAHGTETLLEWNPGNHFRDPELRTAKAFAWLLKGA